MSIKPCLRKPELKIKGKEENMEIDRIQSLFWSKLQSPHLTPRVLILRHVALCPSDLHIRSWHSGVLVLLQIPGTHASREALGLQFPPPGEGLPYIYTQDIPSPSSFSSDIVMCVSKPGLFWTILFKTVPRLCDRSSHYNLLLFYRTCGFWVFDVAWQLCCSVFLMPSPTSVYAPWRNFVSFLGHYIPSNKKSAWHTVGSKQVFVE